MACLLVFIRLFIFYTFNYASRISLCITCDLSDIISQNASHLYRRKASVSGSWKLHWKTYSDLMISYVYET